MIQIAAIQWDKNKDILREKLAARTDLNNCSYLDLVKLTFDVIFNANLSEKSIWKWSDHMLDIEHITEIDNGDYQGTLLYLIPFDTYQPGAGEYLMTHVSYGSCSGCDLLQYIQMLHGDDVLPTQEQITAFMNLCKDLICNTIKPYNYGWNHDPDFNHTEGLIIDS